MARMFTEFPDIGIPFEVERRLGEYRQEAVDWSLLAQFGYRLARIHAIPRAQLREWSRGEDISDRNYRRYIDLHILPHIRGSVSMFKRQERLIFEDAYRRAEERALGRI